MDEINEITAGGYVLGGVIVLSIAVGVLVWRNQLKKKTNHVGEKNNQDYKEKILIYLRSIEQDYYRDYLTNYLSMTFDIDEYDEEYRYQVKNLNSLKELGVEDENLNASNRFMNELCDKITGKKGEKTPDLALSFLVEIYRNKGRLKALKHIGKTYEVQENFPEKYKKIENELIDTRQRVVAGY